MSQINFLNLQQKQSSLENGPNISLIQLKNSIDDKIDSILQSLGSGLDRNAKNALQKGIYQENDQNDLQHSQNSIEQCQIKSSNSFASTNLEVIKSFVQPSHLDPNDIMNEPIKMTIPILHMNKLTRYQDENLEMFDVESISSINQFGSIKHTEDGENNNFMKQKDENQFEEEDVYGYPNTTPIRLRHCESRSEGDIEEINYNYQILQVPQEYEFDNETEQNSENEKRYASLDTNQFGCAPRKRSKTTEIKKSKLSLDDHQIPHLAQIRQHEHQVEDKQNRLCSVCGKEPDLLPENRIIVGDVVMENMINDYKVKYSQKQRKQVQSGYYLRKKLIFKVEQNQQHFSSLRKQQQIPFSVPIK